MNKNLKFLHTPPGSKPFYKEEVLFRNKIEKTLSGYFEKWGFFPIETPIIDYFDVYSPLLSDEIKRGSIRFVDRDGELILLRNDITLFAAKLVASRVIENKQILRYYYSDAIIRCEKSGANLKNIIRLAVGLSVKILLFRGNRTFLCFTGIVKTIKGLRLCSSCW